MAEKRFREDFRYRIAAFPVKVPSLKERGDNDIKLLAENFCRDAGVNENKKIKGISQDAWRKFCAAEVGVELDAQYKKSINLENMFKQDREAMKNGDFTGIRGIPAQDMAMWESMGPIASRDSEILGTSDLSIVKFRQLMLKAAEAVAAGGPAIGTAKNRIPPDQIMSYERILPKSVDWRTFDPAHAEAAE